MIKKSELRSGNLVLFDDTIDAIEYFIQTMAFGIYHSHYEFSRLRPIKITDEWLKRAGFIYGDTWDNTWRKDDLWIRCSEPKEGYYIVENGDVRYKPFFFVHQLQNIYFVLNKCTELTFDKLINQ
jgi:hypothetical protein